MRQRYRRMEDLKSLPVGTEPGFCKGRGLSSSKTQIFNFGNVMRKLV